MPGSYYYLYIQRCHMLKTWFMKQGLNLIKYFYRVITRNVWLSIRAKWKSFYIMFKIFRKMRKSMILSGEDQAGFTTRPEGWSWGFYQQSMWPVTGKTSSLATIMVKWKWKIFMIVNIISRIEKNNEKYLSIDCRSFKSKQHNYLWINYFKLSCKLISLSKSYIKYLEIALYVW